MADAVSPRQRPDLCKHGGAGPAPVLLWVHGGGFMRGARSAGDRYAANTGRRAARSGMRDAVPRYRFVTDTDAPGRIADDRATFKHSPKPGVAVRDAIARRNAP